MKGALIAIGLLVSAPLLAQAIPGVPGVPNPPPQNPPSGGGGGGGGFGGVGLTFTIGKKKKKEVAPELPTNGPPIQMRDQPIPDFAAGQALFFVRGNAAESARIARAARVNIIESQVLDEIGLTMVTAKLNAGDTVPSAVTRLSAQRGVEFAQPNHMFQVLAGNSRDKGLALHGIVANAKTTVKGTIVMIDSPVDIGNTALKGATISQMPYGVPATPSPHGTAIAELLVGTGGFSGVVRGANLISLAAFAPASEKSWLSQTNYLAQAMNQAAKIRPHVLNLSFGANKDDPVLTLLLDAIEKKGTCVVAAAGNGSGGPVLFPARKSTVIATTAVDGSKNGYAFASKGPEVDIAAWGVDMNAAVPGGRRAVSGTSFATAIVSGAMLRLQGCNGGWSPASVRVGIAGLAEDLGAKGVDPIYGAGLLKLGSGKTKK